MMRTRVKALVVVGALLCIVAAPTVAANSHCSPWCDPVGHDLPLAPAGLGMLAAAITAAIGTWIVVRSGRGVLGED